MRMRLATAAFLLALGGCATTGPRSGGAGRGEADRLQRFPRQSAAAQIEHRPSRAGARRGPGAGRRRRLSRLGDRRPFAPRNANHLVVSAGDMIGASPLVSALFLDEPTIHAMNLIRVDYNAVGNHEFDRGQAELLRMQKGGCEKNSVRQPCAVEPFPRRPLRLPRRQCRQAGRLHPLPGLCDPELRQGRPPGEGRDHRNDPEGHSDGGDARRSRRPQPSATRRRR